MKLIARVKRRKDGTFEAYVQDAIGRVVWNCNHAHNYGTSNRVKQDSASKCGFAKVKELRQQQETHEQFKHASDQATYVST